MFRASRCRQRPSVVRAGRLGLLPKVAAVGLGAGLVQLWSGPGSGDLGDHAGVRLGALSARPHSAMRCTESHPPASLPSWGKRTPESGRTEACEVAALATHGRGHRTFRRGGRNSSLVSPSLRRPLSKSACLIKTCKLCGDTLAPYSATVGLIVEPRLGSYPHSAGQVLPSARRSCIQLVASRPVRWSGLRAPARWRAAGVCRGSWTVRRARRRHRSVPPLASGRLWG